VLSVVLRIIEPHDLGTLSVVHVFGVVVVFIKELIHHLVAVGSVGDAELLNLKSCWVGAEVLQVYRLFRSKPLASLLIMIKYNTINFTAKSFRHIPRKYAASGRSTEWSLSTHSAIDNFLISLISQQAIPLFPL
jgi:hypothetical protein